MGIFSQNSIPSFPLIFKPPRRPFLYAILATSIPTNHRSALLANADTSATKNISGLGQTLSTAINSNPDQPIPVIKQKNSRRGKENQAEEKHQISGSDVLMALQRAAAQKNKASFKKKKKGLFSSGRKRDDDDYVDYSKVKPLQIKSDWGDRLDDLDKRLQELSETSI